MSHGLPLFPVYLMDFFGAILMVCLSIMAFRYAKDLMEKHPKSVLFSYLFWLSISFVALSISRSFGHAVRFILMFWGETGLWKMISPFSGGLNTMTFVSVGILTFYYPNIRGVMALIREEAEAVRSAKEELEATHRELRELNRTLEDRVRIRTQELMLSQQKFRRLFENSKDAIFFCDEKGCISDMNQSGVELLGYTEKEEIVGVPMKDFFAKPMEWRTYYASICKDGFIKDFDAEFVKKDGSTINMIISAAAIRDEKGKPTGCEGIAKDITAFKKMTEKLIYSEKMAAIGQLAAGVAHEINTPLGIILGYTQLLKEDFEDNQEILKELEIVEKQTKNCKRIVSDLLSFARSTSTAKFDEVDVNECLKHTVALIRHSLEMDQIELILELNESIPKIYGDRDRISQVFLNILTNAHQAIGKNGLVMIRTRYHTEKRRVFIEIGDSGPGVPDEIKKKMFDPFFTTKPVGKGTGLGLSVSYGIIKEIKGVIEVFSPPEDEVFRKNGINTVFVIEFPIERSGPEQANQMVQRYCMCEE